MRRDAHTAMRQSQSVSRTLAGRRFVASVAFRHYWAVVDAGFPFRARHLSRKGSGPVDGKGERGEQHSVRHASDAVLHDPHSFRADLIDSGGLRRPEVPLGPMAVSVFSRTSQPENGLSIF
jgi:hypothetical protein